MVFVDLIEHLLTELSKNDSMSTTRTYIQCIAAISRQAGHRIGKKKNNIIICNFKSFLVRVITLLIFFSYQVNILRK